MEMLFFHTVISTDHKCQIQQQKKKKKKIKKTKQLLLPQKFSLLQAKTLLQKTIWQETQKSSG